MRTKKRDFKKATESGQRIARRLIGITENLHGAEFKEIKKELYRLELKLTSQSNPARGTGSIDIEINNMLDELPEYINGGCFNVISNYMNRLGVLIDSRELSGKGVVDVKENIFTRVFGGKSKDTQPDRTEREIFDLRNKMLAEFDKIDKFAAERKKLIYEAKKLSPGDPREIGYARDIEECDRRTRASVTAAKVIADSLSIKTAFKDMGEHKKLMESLAKAQTSSDELESLAGHISVYKESFRENSERSNEIIRGMDNDGYHSDGLSGSGLAAINEARAMDENLKDLEIISDSEQAEESDSVNASTAKEPELR